MFEAISPVLAVSALIDPNLVTPLALLGGGFVVWASAAVRNARRHPHARRAKRAEQHGRVIEALRAYAADHQYAKARHYAERLLVKHPPLRAAASQAITALALLDDEIDRAARAGIEREPLKLFRDTQRTTETGLWECINAFAHVLNDGVVGPYMQAEAQHVAATAAEVLKLRENVALMILKMPRSHEIAEIAERLHAILDAMQTPEEKIRALPRKKISA